MEKPKVSIVHDWFVDFGGAEKVAESLVEIFGVKDVYTLFYDEPNFKGSPISMCRINTSFLDRDFFKKRYRNFLVLFPYAIEQFEIKDCDVIISSSHCVAHGVITGMDQLHISYCHTPLRYAWDMTFEYLELSGLKKGIKSIIARLGLHYMRLWDQSASKRVDHYVANSNFVAKRIKRFYGKSAEVIYPPCETAELRKENQKGEHFVFASRLVPYKRADLAIKAAAEMKIPLKIVGDGPQYKELKENSPSSATFLGHLPKEELYKEIASARALIFPTMEDFGILPVEAQALGTPVIAFGKGGALETVVGPSGDDFSGATGLFFKRQDAGSVSEAVGKFLKAEKGFKKEVLVKNAGRFSKERFQKEMRDFVDVKWREHEHPLS